MTMYHFWSFSENDRFARTPTPDSEGYINNSSQSDISPDMNTVRSEVVLPDATPQDLLQNDDPLPGPSSDVATQPESLPPEILDALGDPQSKEEVMGPAINNEISKRWGRVIIEGMTKEAKESIIHKTLIPENFRLAKAPKLNLEIAAVLGDTVKNRDKLLEKSQNHLGLGIAGLTNLASELIDKDLDKVYLLKKLSEVSQIFLDLHFENTKTRRKLITNSLDKKFNSIVADVKRDEFLFGAGLGEKIKATKTAERSGFQIKRTDNHLRSNNVSQGNWRGPPRNQAVARVPRQGGQRNRHQPYPSYHQQATRRQPPTTNRPPPAPKPNPGLRRP